MTFCTRLTHDLAHITCYSILSLMCTSGSASDTKLNKNFTIHINNCSWLFTAVFPAKGLLNQHAMHAPIPWLALGTKMRWHVRDMLAQINRRINQYIVNALCNINIRVYKSELCMFENWFTDR